MIAGVRGRLTALLSALLAAIGVVLIVETAVVGGWLGYLFGALFLAAGALRLYLSTRL